MSISHDSIFRCFTRRSSQGGVGDTETPQLAASTLSSAQRKLRRVEGGCSCGEIRYRLTAEPMIVHCCHCRNCQQQTGSAFVINLVIEAGHVELLRGEPVPVEVPREPQYGTQTIFRCPRCQVAVYSTYTAPNALFVRGGTLDEPGAIAPDVHIFTRSKLPWVQLPAGAPAYDAFYPDPTEVWSPAALERWRALTVR
jgi:hypothetical protein